MDTELPIIAKLRDENLWDEFDSIGNEMIVNKKGRRIFPNIETNISNLDENGMYSMYLSFVKKGSKKFVDGEWISNDTSISLNSEPETTNSYLHPNSPNFGRVWNQGIVSFSSLKVTNNQDHKKNQIYLDTFYQYAPRLTIVKHDKQNNEEEFVASFDLNKASFVAVTSYQNDKTKELKVEHNPFARGFKKRRRKAVDDESSQSDEFVPSSSSIPLQQSYNEPKRSREHEPSLNESNIYYRPPNIHPQYDNHMWQDSFYGEHYNVFPSQHHPLMRGLPCNGIQNFVMSNSNVEPAWTYNQLPEQYPPPFVTHQQQAPRSLFSLPHRSSNSYKSPERQDQGILDVQNINEYNNTLATLQRNDQTHLYHHSPVNTLYR